MNTSNNPTRPKRSNNEGTAPRQRKDGRWQSHYIAGYLPSGKPIRKTVYGKTKAECAAKLKVTLRAVSDKTISLTTSPRFIEWLDYYLEVIAPNTDIKPRTINAYRSKIDNYIRSHRLAGKRLDKLTPMDIDLLYNDARNRRQRHRKGEEASAPLSVSTLQGLHRVLRRALNVAVNRGVLGANPVLRVELASKSEFKPQVYSTDEVRAMLAHALTMGDGARWVLNLMLGLRQGEALGLVWDDIDFATKRIRISREVFTLPWEHGCQLQGSSAPQCGFKSAWRCPKRHGGGFFTGPPKSEAGVRSAPMPQQLIEALKDHREVQQLQRTKNWEPWKDQDNVAHEFVFARKDGQPMNYRADWASWKVFLRGAGVPDGRVHDGRHTAATTLLLLGIEPRVVMEILGWSQVSMLTRYQHVLDEMHDDVSKKLTAHWTPEPEPQSNIISLADRLAQRPRGAS